MGAPQNPSQHNVSESLYELQTPSFAMQVRDTVLETLVGIGVGHHPLGEGKFLQAVQDLKNRSVSEKVLPG
jgi:hypothetical protein